MTAELSLAVAVGFHSVTDGGGRRRSQQSLSGNMTDGIQDDRGLSQEVGARRLLLSQL